MRTALIVGVHVSGGQGVMLQPCDPRTAADTFKRFLVAPPDEVAEIQLWESGAGITKRKRFREVVKPAAESLVEQSSPTATAPIPPAAENAAGGDAGEQVAPAGEEAADAPSLIPDEAPPKKRR